MKYFGIIMGFIFIMGGVSVDAATKIKIKPLSIRQGLESQISTKTPLKDSTRVMSSPTYQANKKRAHTAGVDLKDHIENKKIALYNVLNNHMFVLFYNHAQARTCKREYLIQRIKMEKTYFDLKGKEYKSHDSYFVEVMKLNKKKRTYKADETSLLASLDQAHRVQIKLNAEIGCGEIPGAVEGGRWMYPNKIQYNLIQNYSDDPGYYDKVRFDYSRPYIVNVQFDKEGQFSVIWPDFIPK